MNMVTGDPVVRHLIARWVAWPGGHRVWLDRPPMTRAQRRKWWAFLEKMVAIAMLQGRIADGGKDDWIS